ncbi:MAG: hypothetical protein M3R68_09315 [Acidobacteriota bacterium]|nr:hypothetical protein [Acidobacteriota bacterium]
MKSSILVLLLLPLLPLSFSAQRPELPDFALEKLRGDASVRIEDAYTLIYQATRGNGQPIKDEKIVREELQREWGALGEPLPDEKLWEPLRADEKVGRLNLRPFRARGGKLEDLLAAFLQSAKDFPGDQTGKGFLDDDQAECHIAWNTLGMALDRQPVGKLNWPEWRRLDEDLTPKEYPAIHHSESFVKSHKPAYRLLTHEQSEKLISALK